MQLRTMDYFSCAASYDLGVFGPFFRKLPQCFNTSKTGITNPHSDYPGKRVRCYLMFNEDLKSLDYFSCDPVHDLGYSNPVSLNCAYTRVPGKQVKLNPQKPLTLE